MGPVIWIKKEGITRVGSVTWIKKEGITWLEPVIWIKKRENNLKGLIWISKEVKKKNPKLIALLNMCNYVTGIHFFSAQKFKTVLSNKPTDILDFYIMDFDMKTI